MKRRIVIPEERGFIIREDALDDLEGRADWLRRGCDKVEQLRVSEDIKVIIGKVRSRPL